MRTKSVFFLVGWALLLFGGLVPLAQSAPVQAPISGEIERLTLNNPADPWSGGTIQVDGGVVILPRNLLIDLPANRLTLTQIFAQAPAACVAAGESGLAKADTCNISGAGGFATIAANVTNGGNTIAGDVFIEKGRESVTGPITFINYTDGYFRINGNALNATQVDDNTGIMVRFNDPTSRHSVQQGLGCLPGAANCSPDPRFTLDPDNYVIVFTTGYPVCIPSTVSRTFVDVLGLGTTTAQALADGTGDVLCPATNRTISGGQPVDDSRRFAPIQLGDNVTAEGNFESINCVRFVSAHSMKVAKALTTKTTAGQPDYMFLDEVFIDAPGFQNQRARSLFIGYTTLAPADVLIWSLHRDPATNAHHEFPLATTAGCDAAAGPLTCTGLGITAGGGDIFRIRHDVDFGIGAKPRLDPCAHLISDPRMWPLGTNTICPNSPRTFPDKGLDNLDIAEMFGILSPIPHEIQARTGRKFSNPGLITLDINGNQATNGQYLFPFGIGLGGIDIPNFFEIDINLVQTPYSFSGIPWNLDRRLSPGGCNGACEGTPQPLDPFPFEGLAMDPRLQAPPTPPFLGLPTGPYNDTNFTQSVLNTAPYGTSNRILSYVNGTAFSGRFNFDGNNTVLAWPPADPAHIAVPAGTPVPPRPSAVAITSFPVFTATQGQLYSYQVVATSASACSGITYSLDLIPVPPVGMTINPATGLIQWTPTATQVGSQSVVVRATDGSGAFDTQPFGIAVAQGKKVANDLNGDGLSDVLWRNTATGEGSLWLMNGASLIGGGPLPTIPVEWTIAGTGDFNNDAKADILWRNTVTGEGSLWLMNGSSIIGGGPLATVPLEWTIAGTGDFNNDGTDEILWRNTITGEVNMWFMNGGSQIGVGPLLTIPLDWTITGTGDFNNDGKADILWRNTTTGEGSLWLMNGVSLIGGGPLPTVPVAWTIAGTGDFNNDATADILWRNTTTGEVNVWLMNGASLIGGGPLPTVPLSWTIAGTGDFNNDATADILWRNTTTGEGSLWLMNGVSLIGGGPLPTVPLSWTIAAP